MIDLKRIMIEQDVIIYVMRGIDCREDNQQSKCNDRIGCKYSWVVSQITVIVYFEKTIG